MLYTKLFKPNRMEILSWSFYSFGGPDGRFERHPDGVQQEQFFIWIQECGTCFIPNFSSPIEWKHSHDHQTHVEGPGGQCEGHLGEVQQEILLDFNIRVRHMFYTQLFKPKLMETIPWPSNPCRMAWWTMWRTSRKGSAKNKVFLAEPLPDVLHIVHQGLLHWFDGHGSVSIRLALKIWV